MVEFYPSELSGIELIALKHQLGNYMVDVHEDKKLLILTKKETFHQIW